ncbi:hypothetical protein FPOAC2_11183 [Fusarium poae]
MYNIPNTKSHGNNSTDQSHGPPVVFKAFIFDSISWKTSAVTPSSLQCWEVESQYAHETGYAIRNPSFAGFPHVPNDVLTQSRYNNVPRSQKKPPHFASPRLL